MEEHGPGKRVAGLALVQSGVRAAAQRRVGDPVEREQGPLDAADFPQRLGQGILPGIGRQPAHQRRRRDGSGPGRRREAQHFSPVLFDDAQIDHAADHRLQNAVVGAGVSDIEAAIGKITDARREPESKQMTETEDLFGHAACVGVMFLDSERSLVMKKAVENVQRPEPPVDFVRRPDEFQALKAKLLDSKGDAVAISAALKGAGGYGKTTLAKALAHDPDIQEAYFDGVLWVELGENPDNLLGKIADLIETLTGAPPGFQTIDAAAAALGEALGGRRILMIVDDVWREQDLRPFLRGGSNTTRLITTRLSRVLPADAFRQPVDAMKGEEARVLLASGLPKEQVLAQTQELSGLAGRLGEWAQLLKLVNGFLCERVNDGGERLQGALADADARLTEEGLVAFDADDEGDRSKAVAQTINLSLKLLDEKQRERFAELAIFPEDADIPMGIVARLWRETAGLSEGQTKDLSIKLYGLSLLLGLDLNQRTLRFHDTIRRFLQDRAGKEGLVARHKQLLRALDEIGGSPETDALSKRYFYQYLPHHLAEAKERDRLDMLLLDPGWLKAKLSTTGNSHALVADYERYGAGELQNFIGRTLRLTAGILARDQRQLMPQLLGRIMNCKGVGTTAFLEGARSQISPPAILTQRLSLTPPGAETARLEGHSNW